MIHGKRKACQIRNKAECYRDFVFYKKGLLLHAINNLETAKLANPKDIGAFKKLGELYVKREDYHNAKIAYEAALKINPNDTEVIKSLKNLDALGTMKREFGS